MKAVWGPLPIVPIMETGATDGLYLRNAGVPVYGFSGLFIANDDVRAHGKDERILVTVVRRCAGLHVRSPQAHHALIVRKTFSHVMTEYGVIALILYLVIFVLVLIGVYSAIKAGWSPKGFAGQTGTWVIAYLITKATTPFRLAGTIALAPLVARAWDRMRGRSRTAPPESSPPS